MVGTVSAFQIARMISFLPTSLRWLLQHPVCRRHPLRTISRWIYWQVRYRLTSAPLRMDFIRGTMLEIYPREGLTGYWYVTLPDFDEQMFLLRFLRAGDRFLDVGANAGAFSVMAASSGCLAAAFEPVPETFERLKANARLNAHIGSIEVMPKAVGAQEGVMHMTTRLGTGNHLIEETDGVADSVAVQVTTLDAWAATHGFPSFIKIDVEGHELEVIQGGADLLRSDMLLGFLIETFRSHNWQLPKLREMEAVLAARGFFPYDYDAAANQLRSLKLPHEGGNNTLYLRDLKTVSERLENVRDDFHY